MIEFTVNKVFSCDQDLVWKITSDINSIPKYWKGTRELNVKQISKNVYEGSIRFAFPSTGRVKIIINEADKTLTFQYLSGPIKGFNVVKVSKNQISSKWEVSMSLLLKIFEKRNAEHFKLGTEHALERIIEECQILKQQGI
ncbi:SRPBCC family protein [Acidianus sulfidivorans JP7]|uniref:SRPBCC family protein n=1 Tax=Acidianus sulfidivorans JP7 TaxID=619593 RepID=A0A2U9IL51_9CREN|nr:SRPBCC family protein [Acidianus sulfidivorans]AWR96743.1 SRPBCC family protein [Acidianus sulfidivorans JP7]